MIFSLALRNLLHDRTRWIATFSGLCLSVTLIGVQLGLYFGSCRLITSMIDHAGGQIWLMPQGTESFEDGNPIIDELIRLRALATPGVVSAVPLVVAFADWHKPDDALTHVVVVGADPSAGGLAPWGIVEGEGDAISRRSAVAVERSYSDELGVGLLGDRATIEGLSAHVSAVTNGIRSFTQSPYVFTSAMNARKFLEADKNKSSFVLVSVEAGSDPEDVKKRLAGRLGDIEVLTTAEFRERSLDRWLVGTGAGAALVWGLVLGIVIGTVIVAQTIYSSTNEHLVTYATLRAFGSSTGYLRKIVMAQALLTSLAGFGIGSICVGIVAWSSSGSPLPLVVTPLAFAELFAITLAIGMIAAIGALVKVTNTDPALVFAR